MIVELPDHVADALWKVAARFQKSTQETIEGIILDLTPSTKEDLERQRDMRQASLRKFLDSSCPKNPESAWLHGYARGWWEFQIRKVNNLFPPRTT
jgi:hypothetical protein